MPTFNAKQYENNTILACTSCGKEALFRKAQNGCPSCGFYLLKVSHRGTMEKMNPYYQMDEGDPYIRQKDKATGTGSGRGGNLTRPADEESSGGFGTRFRGKEGPKNWSSKSNDYEDEENKDVPSSHDDLISNPPMKDDLGGWFFDPEDPLSTRGEIDEKRKNNPQTMENRLRVDQQKNDEGLNQRLDDNVFDRIRNKQKGVKR